LGPFGPVWAIFGPAWVNVLVLGLGPRSWD
jgi:hypothetical protein